MNKIYEGSWVEIENIVLLPNERAPQIPDDTKSKPLKMWTKGLLIQSEAQIGDEVTIRTLSGRLTSGKLVENNPRFTHDFGSPVKELIETGMSLKSELGEK